MSTLSRIIAEREEAAKKAVKAQSRAERLKGLPQLEEELLPYTFNPLSR